MTVEAYVVPGWPSSVPGHAAVTPHLNRMAASGAVAYKDGVTGQPGTQTIPVTGPGVEQGKSSQARMGLSRTSDAPPWFLPNLYYARPEAAFWPGAGMPVSIRSDNLMPVPATDPRGIPARLAIVPARRGNGQIKSFAPVVRWPAVNG
jgi:hypothetical protein